jgi:hypothetical protein
MKNQRGSVLVFVILLIPLLLFLVGIGLDTGMITYTRAVGQSSVDASALAAASALPTGDIDEVNARAAHFGNDFVISENSVNLVVFDEAKDRAGQHDALRLASGIAEANAVRVSLENSSPYGGTTGGAIRTPSFLTPIARLLGAEAASHVDINVTATAVLKGKPDLPIAIKENQCAVGPKTLWRQSEKNENICWTTYTLDPANAPTVRELIEDTSCTKVPPVQKGTEINFNNGEIHNAHVLLDSARGPFDGSQCFLIPVIPSTSKCNQSAEILSFAKVCVIETGKSGPGYINVKIESCDTSLLGAASMCSQTVLVRDRKSGM